MAKQVLKAPSHSDLLHRLFFVAATHNFSVAMSHLPGCNNKIADALSRNKLTEYFTLVPQAEPLPTQIPPELDDIYILDYRASSTMPSQIPQRLHIKLVQASTWNSANICI